MQSNIAAENFFLTQNTVIYCNPDKPWKRTELLQSYLALLILIFSGLMSTSTAAKLDLI